MQLGQKRQDFGIHSAENIKNCQYKAKQITQRLDYPGYTVHLDTTEELCKMSAPIF